ncbi:MAG: extracellular solute-binding protein [Pseudomonadota bacterium]
MALLRRLMVLIAGFTMVAGSESTAGEVQTALAMHGDPAYPPDMTHFAYADLDAQVGGTLRLTAVGTFDNLNPYIILGVPAQGLGLVFESLMERSQDEPFTLYPLIAESIELADDRSWITFHINPEARFQDGTPVTADDVLFTWRTLRDEGRPHTRTYYSEVTEAEALDSLSVRFTFRSGNWEMPLIMGLMPVLSMSYFETHEFDKTTLQPPLGTGPYRVAQVEAGQRIVYQRDPDYWGWDLPVNQGRYNFDQISYTYFRDANAALQAFLAGDVDARFEDDETRWATGYDTPAARRGDIITEEVQHGRPSGMSALVFNTRRDLFDDVRVREALGLAFDFEWTNRNLLHGAYERTTSMFDNADLASSGLPVGMELALLEPYRDQLPPELFNEPFALSVTDGSGQLRQQLQAARDLLSDAGWQVIDGTLTRSSDGRTFDFEILLDDSRWERILLPYTRNLARLGITARLRTVDSAQYQLRRSDFDYDAIVYRWGQSLSPGNEQFIYWSSEAAESPGSRNYAGVTDPVVDSLITKLVDARDRDELVAAARALDRVLLWGHYGMPLFHLEVDNIARWSSIERPAISPLYGPDISTWWQSQN